MQALVKKYFFVVNLVFVAAAAYLTARAANKFVGYFIAKAIPEDEAPQVAKAATRPDRRSGRPKFEDATERNIFEAKREKVEEAEVTEEAQDEVDTSADPVPTDLRLKLIATSAFDVPEWSLATIEDLGSRERSLYSVNACPTTRPAPRPLAAAPDVEGEGSILASVEVRSDPMPFPCNRLLDSATIIDIQVDRVVFVNETSNRLEYLDFNAEPKGGPAVASAAPVPKRKDDEATGKGIRQVGANSYEVAQSEIDSTLSNLNTIATQARIVPSFQDGKSNGFKLFSIRPDSLYSKIGIKNGDVVQRINGYEITSPDKALEIYTKLKDSKSVSVDLLRRGKPVSLEYSIVP